MARPTVRDIAKLANVSIATVSYVINDKPGVSEEQRAKVQEVMRQLNYVPTARSSASMESKDRSQRIAIFEREQTRPLDLVFSMELTSSIINACINSGYDAIVTHAIVNDGKVILPDIVTNKRVDGVLINGDVGLDILYSLRATGLPVVELDQAKKYVGQKSVTADYHLSAYTGAKHLIELGHRDIAFITSDMMYEYNMLTFRGFQQATSESNVNLDMSRLQLNVGDSKSLLNLLKDLINNKNLPTAFFCATDTYAVCLLQILNDLGIKVPEDISVIAIDDTFVAKYAIPPLTAVHIDRDLIAKGGITMLTKLIDGEAVESMYVPSSSLVLRKSTAAPRLHQIKYSSLLPRLKDIINDETYYFQ